MRQKNRGFTLLELLIVIVVIGVLAAMMMLSSTEAVTSAKATKIISDLNTLKRAVIAWYTDNYHRVTREKSTSSTNIHSYNYMIDTTYYLGTYVNGNNKNKQDFLKYMNNANITLTKDNNAKNAGDYFLATEGAEWYVGCNVGLDTRLREKLAGRAKSAGLLGGTKQKDKNGNNKTDTASIEMYDTEHDKVYMLIIAFE